MQLSETELIERAVKGDRQAFQSLVEAHQSFAYALAYRLTGTAHDAEDMVQETFIRLWKHLHSYRPEVKLTTWLYTIVTNVCLDFLKSTYGKKRNLQTDMKSGLHISASSTPEDVLQNKELMQMILEIAQQLTPRQKAVFTLCDLQGLGLKEISEILSLSTGTIKSNLWYARKKIGEQLRTIYNEPEKKEV